MSSKLGKMKILLTGMGVLGQSVLKAIKGNGHLIISASRGNFNAKDHHKIDIRDKKQVNRLFIKHDFYAAIHTAAFVDVDGCEKDKKKAFDTNVIGTKNIADECKKKKIKLIYVSTASVFDGKKNAPYTEEDNTSPINYYSQTKLEGEKIASNLENNLIYRVDYTYGPYGKYNFAKWIINSISDGRKVSICDDELFTPTYSVNAAENVIRGIDKDLRGIFHIGSSDYMTKYDFAVKAAKKFDLDSQLIFPVGREVVWKGKTIRPKNSFMNCSKAVKHGLIISSTDQNLENFKKSFKG